ncbi:NAD(P)-dependent alcohol dehydrogenase [Cryobacterium sp. TMT2-14]|uniref:NAD(P)-dependent alcohol dehydrogenase n=1 Tax=Cryobacterium sp. TMT2-14 TaxID=1259245 RepID=UPI0010698C4B|nr:NAD(P)-dependent alcohol dehydrogenase [Cryobacterium sp. TMT2-14]TFC33925.1 NAD(P)-dependent alcohol dehydrogenase [Cryobacterium sp. TMT2-14]
MKAIIQRAYGGPETLEYTDVPMPVPRADEVLIRVHAASVNAADWLLMHGEPYLVRLAFGLRAPRIAVRGRDAAGVVVAVGSAVRRVAVNDEVYAEVNAGSFAEFTVATEKVVARKPATLTFEQAATVPIAATTALQGLRDAANLQPRDRILVNGASGGVGSFAVQLAKAFGAEVTAVCSTRNAELARGLGADHVIDYTSEDFTAQGRQYEVIFDLIGNRSLSDCRRALTPRGTLVLSSAAGGRLFGPIGRILAASALGVFSRQSLRPLVASASATDLDVIRELIDSDKVAPQIETTYPLSRTADALHHFGEEHTRGKIAISIWDGVTAGPG